jgi:hypothetical protein
MPETRSNKNIQLTASQSPSLAAQPTTSTTSMSTSNATDLAALVREMKQMSENINNMRAESKCELEKISANVSGINAQISTITTAISQVKADLASTQTKLETLQVVQDKHAIIVDNLTSLANQQQQKELATNIAIYNIPKSLDKATALNQLNTWSSDLLSDNRIRRAVFVPSSINPIFQTAYVTFWSERDRWELNDFIKAKQKDVRGKFSPILAEQIFKLPADSPCKAVTINFQGQMTKLNRDIFNYLRNATIREEVNVYVGGNGLVNVKFSKNAVPISVSSLEHAESLIAARPARQRPTKR